MSAKLHMMQCLDCLKFGTPISSRDKVCGNCNSTNTRMWFYLADVEQNNQTSAEMRSAVELSRALGTPVADHQLLLDWADQNDHDIALSNQIWHDQVRMLEDANRSLQATVDRLRVSWREDTEDLKMTIKMMDDNRQVREGKRGVKAWDGAQLAERVAAAIESRRR